MPLSDIHKRKFSKNMAVALAIVIFIAVIFYVTILKMHINWV